METYSTLRSNTHIHTSHQRRSLPTDWIMCVESKSFVSIARNSNRTYNVCTRDREKWKRQIITETEHTSTQIWGPINLNDTSTVFRCISPCLTHHCSFHYHRKMISKYQIHSHRIHTHTHRHDSNIYFAIFFSLFWKALLYNDYHLTDAILLDIQFKSHQ